MNIQQALNLLGLKGEVTEETLKKHYKKLALKYHPDRNVNGLEMMKAINEAVEVIKNNLDKISNHQNDEEFYDFGEVLNQFLNELNNLAGIEFEVLGNWVWIGGDTKTHKEKLKELKCYWANKKKLWYFRPEEYKCKGSKGLELDEIRNKYGSSGKKSTYQNQLNHK